MYMHRNMASYLVNLAKRRRTFFIPFLDQFWDVCQVKTQPVCVCVCVYSMHTADSLHSVPSVQHSSHWQRTPTWRGKTITNTKKASS